MKRFFKKLNRSILVVVVTFIPINLVVNVNIQASLHGFSGVISGGDKNE